MWTPSTIRFQVSVATGVLHTRVQTSPRQPIRVEHGANALHGGPAAARAMLGQPVSYDRLADPSVPLTADAIGVG